MLTFYCPDFFLYRHVLNENILVKHTAIKSATSCVPITSAVSASDTLLRNQRALAETQIASTDEKWPTQNWITMIYCDLRASRRL